MTREQVIEKLVDEHIEYALINNPTPSDYLFSIFMNGFRGYMNMTNEELVVEYKEIFSEDVQIN
jgi:hypothetical protein